jgi:hypothetical protein
MATPRRVTLRSVAMKWANNFPRECNPGAEKRKGKSAQVRDLAWVIPVWSSAAWLRSAMRTQIDQ